MTDIAIIGSGISALTIAHALKDAANVTIFEKSPGTGGRMATRRAASYSFDHGAQFFTAKSQSFQDFLAPMRVGGIVQRWDARFAEIENRKIISQRVWNEENPHFVGTPGMNAIGRHLSHGLIIRLNTRIEKIEKHQRWRLWTEGEQIVGQFDWVISTIPAPQAREIIPASACFFRNIETVKMKACFSLMLGFEQPIDMKFDAALVTGANISWISVNSSKPGRPQVFCLLVHSSNKWADKHINDDCDTVMNYLCRETSEIVGQEVATASHKALQGWHFANIDRQEGPTYHIDPDARLAVCGDWCIQGRIEAAFISGRDLANHILTNINPRGATGA